MSDTERPLAYRHEKRTARRAHTCCECTGRIAPGEIYHYISGVWSEGPESFKVCCDCESLRGDVDNNVRDDERTAYGYLFESVFNGAEVQSFMRRFCEIADRRHGLPLPEWAKKKVTT
jgi:hypothetical protein